MRIVLTINPLFAVSLMFPYFLLIKKFQLDFFSINIKIKKNNNKSSSFHCNSFQCGDMSPQLTFLRFVRENPSLLFRQSGITEKTRRCQVRPCHPVTYQLGNLDVSRMPRRNGHTRENNLRVKRVTGISYQELHRKKQFLTALTKKNPVL